MDNISAFEVLDADQRPTCVVDLQQFEGYPVEQWDTGNVYWRNKAFSDQPELLRAALRDKHDAGQLDGRARLRAWIADTSQDGLGRTFCESLGDHQLYGYTVARKWRVVQWQSTSYSCERCSGWLPSDVKDASLASASADDAPNDHCADRTDAAEQLASMAATIEMIDVGFCEFDMQGRMIQGNDAYYKLTGHPRVASRTELPEFSFVDRLFDEDKAFVLSRWDMLTRGESTTFEMRWKPQAASTLSAETDLEGQWVLAACKPTRDKNGVIASITGCITDINAQKRMQRDAVQRAEALERAYASEMRFSRFCEYANVPIVILDTNLQVGFSFSDVSFCNREWFNIVGHPVVDFKDIDWTPYIAAEDMNTVKESCERVLHTKQPAKFQFRLRRTWTNGQGDNTNVPPTLFSVYPELNEDGSVRAVAATQIDISHLKWAEGMQQQRIDEALEAKRQQEYFIDFTCHEVRNPLSAVVHCADLIATALKEMSETLVVGMSHMTANQLTHLHEFQNDIAEAVTTIISCSTHQKRIMDDILTLSKLDSKLLAISPSPVKLRSILKDAEKMFEVDAKKAAVTWRVRDDSDPMLGIEWVMLDAGRLLQVLINLVTNALKFTQTEAVRNVTLIMRASRRRLSAKELAVEFVPASTKQRENGLLPSVSTLPNSGDIHQNGSTDREIYVYFVVSDTGCGISDEQKAVVFERFAQASPRTHSKYGGSGLGLFITRELVELQGGEVGVSSSLGEGATFVFYITARDIEAKKSDVPGALVAEPKQRGAEMDQATYNILVVEDNLVNQKVLRKQLEKLGHHVEVASHGGEALSYLKTTSRWSGNTSSGMHVSVVLMDIEMPVMDGITCARRIREAQSRGEIKGHLPIIAVSANARYEQMDQAIASGMDDAISKPFRITELIPKIERLVTDAQATKPG
ncbi:hypothetical protein BAUCODRAFT_61546 [Baudoinia panamericana UAMH 10762]|uniref:Histidine kinase n=1 Tax=Baudoinia panamericana (strain UAMH 10762) TaxID=717646 RepID=M2NM51_BAUPA|nr:uncharacterized protein BAUCODRAFT_61546 [Baudoinia panamericana UAMH 10762]EMD00575.1 hypothetical protein BAUCODRAFT_61546 [Baudoinia panamericana UAMH 10762]